MTSVGIFHLVRRANGPAPFRAFLASLAAHPPRARDWELVLIAKGYRADEVAPLCDEAAALGLPAPPRAIAVDDRGFDIGAYFAAAARTGHEVIGCFNSYCEIVAPAWLDALRAELARPGVGLVGATGSLESVVRNHGIYAREAHGGARVRNAALAVGLRALFPPFPNPHVRTNAFLIRRTDFLATRRFPLRSRLASLVYESGWWSLTRMVQAMGLDVRVVDRDGRGLPPEAWADAGGFRSGAQDRVLVRDNRTLEYAKADDARKARLRRLAFGDDAR